MPLQDKMGCFACDGCILCTKSCCSDCVVEIGEAGDLVYCECVGHVCGPGPDETEPEPEEPSEDDSYVPGDYDPPEEGP